MTLTYDSKVRVRDLKEKNIPDGCDVETCVEVNSPTASLIFAASDEKTQNKWVDAFRKVIKTIKELQEMNTERDKDKKPRDVRGMHSFDVHGSTFHVDMKYKLIKPIGHGAYGVVVSAKDEESKRKVAIKKVANAFEDLVDAKRILREIKLLRHFDHDNIIRLLDVQEPPSMKDFHDVYIVTDLMETDLHRVIYSRQVLGDDHIRYFVYQILKALKYMHSAGVLHRDIKPSNLLLNADCDLKLCDFGLARGVEDEAHTLTEYVVTRWYRAPEIMLACPNYTNAIDVWATGCILAELYGRQPIFPGHDYLHQLKLISDYIGTPDEDGLGFVTSRRARKFMLELPRKEPVNWAEVFPSACKEAVDLLEKMLRFDPDKRITVDDALQHPYMKKLYTGKEPTCPRNFQFDEEDLELSKSALMRLIYKESTSIRGGGGCGGDERNSTK
jgi:mitogen-activated protein kinase 1/3